MSKAPSNFRKSDIVRAFAAAKSAGIERPRIEYVLPNGAKIIFAEQPEGDPPLTVAKENPWDKALNDAAHEKRSA